jgi:ABC-type sugar transport system ATPase subunit
MRGRPVCFIAVRQLREREGERGVKAAEGKQAAEGRVILRLDGITKLYPGSIALFDARMDVREGEVHGIIGKNGAGKSTLVNVVSGITPPTGGIIEIGGDRYGSLTRQRAKRKGIAIVTQEPEVIPDFTVAENLFFPDYLRRPGGRITWGDINREAGRMMERAGLRVNVLAKMSDLPLSEQQLVLVAKAFYLEKAKIIILDEVTASLSSKDAAFLYEIIAAQKRGGKAILFISHHMGEILEICDRVTVLRDGKTVATEERKTLDKQRLSLFIVGGKDLAAGSEGGAAESRVKTGDPVLTVKGLTRAGAFYDVSFDLRGGEILGIAGLRGSGRTELLKAIAGVDRADEGRIFVKGEERAFRSPAEAFAGGVVYLPENRDGEGLVENLSVRENLSLSSLRHLTRGAFINKREERIAVEGLIDMLSIVTPSPEQEVRNLSGGNRQKVVVGKIFAARPLVYLLDEPTRGIDISAKMSILAIIKDRLASRAGVIMTAPGLEDLVGVCDRILILCGGRVVNEFFRGAFGERDLYLAIHGMDRARAV